MVLPSWWDGVECVVAWAKGTHPEYEDTSYYKSSEWFGKMLYFAFHHRGNKKFLGEDYKKVGDALQLVAQRYAKWVFTKALPKKGFELIEYSPTEADFPEVAEMEAIEIPNRDGSRGWGQNGYRYEKKGMRPSGTRMTFGQTGQKSYRVGEAPPPLPAKILLLLDPTKTLAWMISETTGEDAWKEVGKGAMEYNASSFREKFRRVGDRYIHIVPDYEPKSEGRTKERPQKVGPYTIGEAGNKMSLIWYNPPKKNKNHITWAYSEGIVQLISNLYDGLMDRKEWSGKPLVEIDLTEKKVMIVKRKLKVAAPKDEPQAPQKPPKGASWEAVKAYINATQTGQKLERSVALYRHLHPSKNEREVAKETGVSQPSVNRWKNRFPDE
jgi:hypothetical protein